VVAATPVPARLKIHRLADPPRSGVRHAGTMAVLETSVSVDKTKRLYQISLGLFSALFLGSAVFGLVDIQASYDEYRHLGFPGWALYPLSLAKVLGIIAIVSNRSKTLKSFAYAGFLYDLLLALGGHISQREVKIILPVVSIGLWAFTFVMDRRMHPESA
jgi:DoxX-like family